MEKKLTINDIAQMSGVAKSTVSRYLNGGSVKDATAQKIKKIIEENNYEPNLFARLNAKESRIIGLTVPGFNSITTPRLVEVIVAYLKKNDYTPLIMHTENDIEEEIRCIERLKNMNVDGIMVLATGSTKEYEEAVKKLKIPILFLGQLAYELLAGRKLDEYKVELQKELDDLYGILHHVGVLRETMQDMRWVIISDNVSSRRFICSGYLKMTRQ